MQTSIRCEWMLRAHAYLRACEAKWGKPFGMTYEELCCQLGRPPFNDDAARSMLFRAVQRRCLRAVRESSAAGRKGGSQVRLRYYAADDLPASPPSRVKSESYFDGLVRVSSVFELGGALGRLSGDASDGGCR